MVILALISILLGAAGQVLVKLGAQNLELNFGVGQWMHSFICIIKNIPVMSGMFLYGLSFILWVKVLTKLELSFAYPLVSIGYLVVMVCSYFFFHEHITGIRIFGTALIIAGVFFITRS